MNGTGTQAQQAQQEDSTSGGIYASLAMLSLYAQVPGVQYSLQTVRPRRYSENLNVSVLCPLPPNFGLSRVYHAITLTDKTPKTGSISTKTCRNIHHTCLPIMMDGLKISATSSVALTQYGEFFSIRREDAKNSFHIIIAIPPSQNLTIGPGSVG